MKPIHGRLINEDDVEKAENICVIDDKIALETYGRTNIVGKTVSVNFGGRYNDLRLSVLQSRGSVPYRI